MGHTVHRTVSRLSQTKSRIHQRAKPQRCQSEPRLSKLPKSSYQRRVPQVSRFPRLNSTVSISRNDTTDSATTTLSSPGRKCHVGCIVACRVHGTRIGQMERERLTSRLCPCTCLRLTASCMHAYTDGQRKGEREGLRGCRWVGCEPLPLGTCAVFE